MRTHWFGVFVHGVNQISMKKPRKKRIITLKDVYKHYGLIKDRLLQVLEKSEAVGIFTITRYRSGMVDEVNNHIKKTGCTEICETVKIIQAKYFLGVATETRNVVVTSDQRGRNLIIQHLKGSHAHELEITHGEIGTGQTSPAASDTALTTATDRKAKALASITAANSITLQFFWADAELSNGTYYECGTYSDSSSLTLGDGRLFNHALFSPSYVKASGEDTTMQVQISFNQ